MPQLPPPTVSLREAADHLGVHYMTAYRYVRTGTLPATMVRGHWRIDRSDLDELAERRRNGARRTDGVPVDGSRAGSSGGSPTGSSPIERYPPGGGRTSGTGGRGSQAEDGSTDRTAPDDTLRARDQDDGTSPDDTSRLRDQDDRTSPDDTSRARDQDDGTSPDDTTRPRDQDDRTSPDGPDHHAVGTGGARSGGALARRSPAVPNVIEGDRMAEPRAHERSLAVTRTGASGTRGARRATIDDRRRRLVDRLVAGDEPGSWALVEEALVGGLEPRQIHLELLGPAMHAIGEGWEAGTLSVGQEHKAAAVCHRIIGRLGPRFLRRGRRRGTVVLAGAPGDTHALPTALAADVVRAAGFAVVDMGASVPPKDLAMEVAGTDRLVAVGITATRAGNEVALHRAVGAARWAVPDSAILAGGAAVDDVVAASLGVDGFGTDAEALVRLLEALPSPA